MPGEQELLEEGEAAEDRAKERPAWPTASAVTLTGLTVEYYVLLSRPIFASSMVKFLQEN